VGGDGPAGRFKRLLHRPSGRKASRQIRDADAVIAPFLLVNYDRVPHLKTSNANRPAGRCFGAYPPGDPASGGDGDLPLPFRVFELVMAAFDMVEFPSIGPQSPDDVGALHSVYHTHSLDARLRSRLWCWCMKEGRNKVHAARP